MFLWPAPSLPTPVNQNLKKNQNQRNRILSLKQQSKRFPASLTRKPSQGASKLRSLHKKQLRLRPGSAILLLHFGRGSHPHWSFLPILCLLRELQHSMRGSVESIGVHKKLTITQQHIKEADFCPAQTLPALCKEPPPTFSDDPYWYLVSSDNAPHTIGAQKSLYLPSSAQNPVDENNNSCHSLRPPSPWSGSCASQLTSMLHILIEGKREKSPFYRWE